METREFYMVQWNEKFLQVSFDGESAEPRWTEDKFFALKWTGEDFAVTMAQGVRRFLTGKGYVPDSLKTVPVTITMELHTATILPEQFTKRPG